MRVVPQPPLPTLTALRFFAAALVLASHLAETFPALRFLDEGAVGVLFFFVLSGFILSWSAREGDTVARFYRRRVARIFPVHLLTWLIAVLVVANLDNYQQSRLGKALALPLLQAWPMHYSVAFAANSVSWSLSVEVAFYAVFPFLIPRLRTMTSSSLVVILAGSLAFFTAYGTLVPDPAVVNLFPPGRLPEFIAGACLSLLVQRGWRPPITFLPAVALSVGVILLEAVTLNALHPLVEVSFAVLIAAAARADLDGTSRLGGSMWVRLGEWSFAMFMTHQLVLRIYQDVVPGHSTQYLAIPVLLGLCLAIAWVTFRFFERPLERLVRGRPPAPNAATATNA